MYHYGLKIQRILSAFINILIEDDYRKCMKGKLVVFFAEIL